MGGKFFNIIIAASLLWVQGLAQTMDSQGNYMFVHEDSTGQVHYMFDINLQKTGAWRCFDKEGLLLYTLNYKEGRLDGELVRYHQGQQVCREVFRNDTLLLSEEYLPSGELIGRAHYGAPIGGYQDVLGLDGELVWVNKRTVSSQPCACRFFYPDSSRQVLRTRGVDGTRYVAQYVDNQQEGVGTLYYSDGKIKSETLYKAGKRNGLMQVYYPTGKVQVNMEYADGLLHGKFKWYHENGKVYVSGQFANGKKTGTWKQYTDKGKSEALTEKPWLREW